MSTEKKIFFAIIAILVAIILFLTFKEKEPYVAQAEYETYVVGTGEVLWNIASERTNKDVRVAIHIIKKDNDLKSEFVRAGQVLKIREEY